MLGHGPATRMPIVTHRPIEETRKVIKQKLGKDALLEGEVDAYVKLEDDQNQLLCTGHVVESQRNRLHLVASGKYKEWLPKLKQLFEELILEEIREEAEMPELKIATLEEAKPSFDGVPIHCDWNEEEKVYVVTQGVRKPTKYKTYYGAVSGAQLHAKRCGSLWFPVFTEALLNHLRVGIRQDG